MISLPVLALGLFACGPELTNPAEYDISGTWLSPDTAVNVTNFTLELSQGVDGAITGSWSATGVVVNGKCPPPLGCSPASALIGSNTVLHVLIDLVGAGAFSGQVEKADRFRGHLAGTALTFRRVPAAQGQLSARGFR